MDPIEAFIKGNNKFSLPALIYSHSRLSILQISKASISYEDILQSLTLSERDMSSTDLNAHAALIYEAVLSPVVTNKNVMALQMNRDIVANDINFIKSVVYVMYSRSGGVDCPCVEEFKLEAMSFLKSSNSTAPVSSSIGLDPAASVVTTLAAQAAAAASSGIKVSLDPSPIQIPTLSMAATVSASIGSAASLITSGVDSLSITGSSNTTMKIDNAPSVINVAKSSSNVPYNNVIEMYRGYIPSPTTDGVQNRIATQDLFPKKVMHAIVQSEALNYDDARSPLHRIEFEKSEPIVRLLAQVRKVGMDILFPQSVHDKARYKPSIFFYFPILRLT